MKSVFSIGVVLLSLTTTRHSALAQRRGNDATAYGWEMDYEAGLETARRSGKPLMVVFRCVP